MLARSLLSAVLVFMLSCTSSQPGGDTGGNTSDSGTCRGNCANGGLAAEDPMMAEVSDAGRFSGGGGLVVGERLSGRYGRIGFYAVGRADEVALQFDIDLTETQMRALAEGVLLPLSQSDVLSYPVTSVDGRPAGVSRQIVSMQLRLLPGRSMEVELELGAIVAQLGNPTERPLTARARFYGAMRLNCVVIAQRLSPEATVSANDNNFESPFCRMAMRDYGLEPVARHLGVPVSSP